MRLCRWLEVTPDLLDRDSIQLPERYTLMIGKFDVTSHAPCRKAGSDHTPFARDFKSPICLVGPGWVFTSGISYYTCRLANAVADHHETSVILLRRLLPRRFYPGRQRVGLRRSSMTFSPDVSVYDGIDWWWGLSMVKALKFLRARHPGILVLEWWTAATLHTYLFLAVLARAFGMRIVIEMHELQDPGEAGLAILRYYGRWGLRALLRLSRGCVVHSESDRRMLESSYGPLSMRIAVAAHGPYDQYSARSGDVGPTNEAAMCAVRSAPKLDTVNLLFLALSDLIRGLKICFESLMNFPRRK